jgi:hypothetical protein
MRAAPPVQLDCARDARWQKLECLLAALAAATLAAWVVAHVAGGGMVAAAPLSVALVAAASAAVGWWRVADAWPRRWLNWDGAGWLLDGVEGRLALQLDAGRWVLLRFQPAGRRRPRWLALDLTASAAPMSVSRAALRWHARHTEIDRADG